MLPVIRSYSLLTYAKLITALKLIICLFVFQISASDIDFWNIRLPELETRQAFGMYPPCFVLRISGASALRSSRLDVSFSGGNSVIEVQIPLETGEYPTDKIFVCGGKEMHCIKDWVPCIGF